MQLYVQNCIVTFFVKLTVRQLFVLHFQLTLLVVKHLSIILINAILRALFVKQNKYSRCLVFSSVQIYYRLGFPEK